MAKKVTNIEVKDATVRTIKHEGEDFVCITDIARQKNSSDPNGVIANWMRNRNTIEFLGIWEQLFNPCFNPLEFEGFRKEAGLNAFTMSPSRWIESTNAKGLVAICDMYQVPVTLCKLGFAKGWGQIVTPLPFRLLITLHSSHVAHYPKD